MSDPHVEWLEYDLQTTWIFDNPPPLQWQGSAFEITLSNAVLRADMRAHCATVDEARAAVEPFLHTWEIDTSTVLGTSVSLSSCQFHLYRAQPRLAALIGSSVTLPESGAQVAGSVPILSFTAEAMRWVQPR